MRLVFEWDHYKNHVNIMKHGVSFEDAAFVFNDPMRIERFDHKHSLAEERWIITGLAGVNILVVNCTERAGKIRIISARKADKKYIEEYFYGYG